MNPTQVYSETILIVEDDPQIRNFIAYALKGAGFKCLTAGTGQDALSKMTESPVDLMLLDLGLPDVDGMQVISRVREWSEVPIIVVSARDQDREKASALDSGADDYLTKPFSATELMARIRVAFRHLHQNANGQQRPPRYDVRGLTIELDKRQVHIDGQEIHVTPNEYRLLSLLAKNAGKVMTTDTIIREIWGPGYGDDTQALRALMASLRRKIEKKPGSPAFIKTEVGVGYRLMDI
ncbi:MAG: response regulator transcription factor [Eubacteriaceae bacterium]|nr:response regulator transcription factor [Eubacteriaceae bacterium]MDD4508222.1 response regulator transcription factor [Eubacteriaceae bacterium]